MLAPSEGTCSFPQNTHAHTQPSNYLRLAGTKTTPWYKMLNHYTCWYVKTLLPTRDAFSTRKTQSPRCHMPFAMLLDSLGCNLCGRGHKNFTPVPFGKDLRFRPSTNPNHWLYKFFPTFSLSYRLLGSLQACSMVIVIPIGSVYSICGNIYHQYTRPQC